MVRPCIFGIPIGIRNNLIFPTGYFDLLDKNEEPRSHNTSTCHVFKIPVGKRRKYIAEFFTNGFENSDKKADDFAS